MLGDILAEMLGLIDGLADTLGEYEALGDTDGLTLGDKDGL